MYVHIAKRCGNTCFYANFQNSLFCLLPSQEREKIELFCFNFLWKRSTVHKVKEFEVNGDWNGFPKLAPDIIADVRGGRERAHPTEQFI
jgi:hypothetical protein